MNTIKIKFVDFWPDFNLNKNYFVDLLSQEWNIEQVDDPDYIIGSVFGDSYKKYNCIRILFTGENTRPDLNNYDYAFTFDHLLGDRHLRLPLYAIYRIENELLVKPTFEELHRERFCAFVAFNGAAKRRLDFFDKLSQYKQVDAGGVVRNNIGYLIGAALDDKLNFLRKYKFSMAFENANYVGYTTEKLFEAMRANTIPIYWGNPLVKLDFNPKSFIDVSLCKSDSEAIKYIIEVDKNDKLYQEIYEQPYFPNGQLTEYVKAENVLIQFRKIFSRGPQDIRRGT